jgi:hypothetical protein
MDLGSVIMVSAGSRDLIAVLRETLNRLEISTEANDPSLAELKRRIVRAIAELEIAKSERISLSAEAV